ncbi:hypothetical protein E2562_039154 [Oryza meyeriana var. granulata]|uniref:Uncharacterized protein n=1 Tax=Oryza meyeriana var. granulata TaxID=110450 RepID=A0A6G1CD47_9ORYZ|nr:hypothetical protein E2562_039154 [Oryza meyeriana var. granulata]
MDSPEEDTRFDLVMRWIAQLREEGLTSTMVIRDFLRRRLAPLQRHSRLAWLYTGGRDATRTHVGVSHN